MIPKVDVHQDKVGFPVLAALIMDSSPDAVLPDDTVPLLFQHHGNKVGNNIVVFHDQDAGYRRHASPVVTVYTRQDYAEKVFITLLVFLVRYREDAVLVAFGLALDLFGLDPDTKGAFDDPGKQASVQKQTFLPMFPEGF